MQWLEYLNRSNADNPKNARREVSRTSGTLPVLGL